MQDRIQYIDSLKGFAIFLVVFAHCIPLQFLAARGGGEFAQMPMKLNDFIYLFHMPLFMFLSGYLFYKPISRADTWLDLGTGIWKRIQSQLIPYLIAGLALYLVKGMFFVYWYLLVLFEFILVCSFLRFIVSRCFKEKSETILMGLYTLIAILLVFVFPKILPLHKAPFLEIEHLSLLPYFVFGIICHKIAYEERILSKEWLFLSIGALMMMAFWGMAKWHLDGYGKTGIQLMFVMSLILVIAYLFYHLPQDSKLFSFFQHLGKYSLEIYILHFFFLFSNPVKWEILNVIFDNRGGHISILLIQMVFVLSETLLVLLCCYITRRIISTSKLLYRLLLGRKIG